MDKEINIKIDLDLYRRPHELARENEATPASVAYMLMLEGIGSMGGDCNLIKRLIKRTTKHPIDKL